MDSPYVHLLRRITTKALLAGFLVALILPLTAGDAFAQDTEQGSKREIVTKSESTQPDKVEKKPWLGDEGNFNGDVGRDAPGGALQKMVVYALLIGVLGVVAIVVLKRLVPRIQRSTGKNLTILETTYIAPRSSVHLLGVGTRKYLISRSGDGVSLLAEVTQALPEEATDQEAAE